MSADFTRVAIVNRGEPAVRFARAVRDYNRAHGAVIRTVAFYAHGNRRARFVRDADEGLDLSTLAGSDFPRRSLYLDHGVLERALLAAKADAVWVGWGFVSEQASFAARCARLGLAFLGPSAAAMRLVGDKIGVKRLATQPGNSVTPWGGAPADTLDAARSQATGLGYPAVVKPTSAAGGRGMRVVQGPEALAEAGTAWSCRRRGRRTDSEMTAGCVIA